MKSTSAFAILLQILFVAVVAASYLEITPFITNGFNTTRGQFRYNAEILDNEGDFFCGGVVIAHEWVLTAAHCVYDVNTTLTVVLGAWNRSDTAEIGRQTFVVPPSNFIWHENWNDTTLQNDIAAIKLPKQARYTKYMQIVKLPKIQPVHSTYEGDLGIVTGWGRTSNGKMAQLLQWAKLPIISGANCQNFTEGFASPEFTICGGNVDGRVACRGDSGGPLVLDDPHNPVLIGLSSFGFPDCATGNADMYTRVTTYLDWIKNKTGVAYN